MFSGKQELWMKEMDAKRQLAEKKGAMSQQRYNGQNVYFFFFLNPEKKIYMCLPYLKFSDLLLKTHLFFNLAY